MITYAQLRENEEIRTYIERRWRRSDIQSTALLM